MDGEIEEREPAAAARVMLTPRARAPKHRYKPRREWKPAFIEALAKYKSVTRAALAVEINRKTAYHARLKDKKFADAWDELENGFNDALETSALERATNGNVRLVLFKGKPVLHEGKLVYERVQETVLTIFLLKKRLAAKYGDEQSGGGVVASELAAELRKAVASRGDYFVDESAIGPKASSIDTTAASHDATGESEASQA